MNTTENNKLIAEFMGFKMSNKIDYIPSSLPNCIKSNEHLQIKNSENMPFHSDWNWLMEAVEKIERIVWVDLNDTSFNVTIRAALYCVIQDNNGGVVEIIGEGQTKIESVYLAVVNFIKWYNKQK